MIKFLMMVFWAIVFYYIFKTVRAVYRLMMKASRMQNSSNNNNNPNTDFGNTRPTNQGRYNINSSDIVDAEFTEIKPEDEKNNDKK